MAKFLKTVELKSHTRPDGKVSPWLFEKQHVSEDRLLLVQGGGSAMVNEEVREPVFQRGLEGLTPLDDEARGMLARYEAWKNGASVDGAFKVGDVVVHSSAPDRKMCVQGFAVDERTVTCDWFDVHLHLHREHFSVEGLVKGE